jgi:hypothetical protein
MTFRKKRVEGRVVCTDLTEHQEYLKKNDRKGLGEYSEAVVDADDD